MHAERSSSLSLPITLPGFMIFMWCSRFCLVLSCLLTLYTAVMSFEILFLYTGSPIAFSVLFLCCRRNGRLVSRSAKLAPDPGAASRNKQGHLHTS